jgi:hypothetical protein
LKSLYSAGEGALVKGILSELISRELRSIYRSELALTLAKCGLEDHALRLFHEILHDDGASSYDIARFVEAWLITRGASCAAELVTIITRHALSAEAQLAVAEELTEHGLLPLAADVWMHMLSVQEQATEHTLTAIARLVGFGCGEKMIPRVPAERGHASYPVVDVARAVASWLGSLNRSKFGGDSDL